MLDKKQVLVLQHFQENPPGRVGDLLEEHGIAYSVVQVGTDHLPDPTKCQALIALGGTQHLYDKHKYPYTVHEEIYLHQAIREGIPYLGMCLGGQLLANAFHATVSRLPKEQIGFLQIHFRMRVGKILFTRDYPTTNRPFSGTKIALRYLKERLPWLIIWMALIKHFVMDGTLMASNIMLN